MSDVGEVAKAISIIGNIVYGELHPAQQSQLREAYDRGREKMDDWEKTAVAGDIQRLAYLWRQCLPAFTVHLSEDNIGKLEGIEVRGLNLNEWTGQFACAVTAEFLKESLAIIKTNEDVSRS